MADQNPSASVRQFVRIAAHLPARIEVHRDHAEQFRLSAPDSESDLAIVDISGGGLGLQSPVMMPRNMRLSLLANVEGAEDTASRRLKIAVIVRRCTMQDHKPTYLIGTQYATADGTDEQELIRWAQRTGQAHASA